MNILDIAIAKKLAGGGGGSGTDNYNDLSNLPKINDTTLSGNKSSSALGLQSEINSDSKLASDLVDDTNQDNKFVTSTEKNTWNGKQNAIDADHKLSSDLVDDANKTNKFVTSTEKNTWNAKQNAIDSDHKLSSSLVSFSTAEAAALASGIDSSKVEQISTNQTNILYTMNRVGKNILPIDIKTLKARNITGTWDGNSYTIQGVTFTVNDDCTISVSGTNTSTTVNAILTLATRFDSLPKIPAGRYTLSGCPSGGGANTYHLNAYQGKTTSPQANYQDNGNGVTGEFDYSLAASNAPNIAIIIRVNYAITGTIVFSPMLRNASISDDTFVPGALPNYDLTRLESEDRASLAEVVDSGAKNLLDLTLARIKRSNESVETPPTWNNNEATVNGVTFTVRNDMTIRVQSDGTNSNQALLYLNSMTDREAVQSTDWITGCPSGGSSSTFEIRIFNSTGQAIKSEFGDGCSLDSGWYAFAILIRAYQTVDIIFKPMICTKAAWDISHNYVPYKFPTTLANNVLDYGSLNDINYNSFIVCKNGVNDFPSGLTPSSWGFVRTSVYDSNSALQEFTAFSANASDNGVSFVRVKQGGTWRAWKQTTNA